MKTPTEHSPKIDYEKWCRRCLHCQFDMHQGILCRLAQQKPDFESECPDFDYDPNRALEVRNELTRQKAQNRRGKIAGTAIMLASLVAIAIFYYFIRFIPLLFTGIFLLGLIIRLKWYFRDHAARKSEALLNKKSLREMENPMRFSPQAPQKKFMQWLRKRGILRIEKTHITRWSSRRDYENLWFVMTQGSANLRLFLVKSLGGIDGGEAREILIYALKDHIYAVVVAAIQALQQSGAESASLQTEIDKILANWAVEEQRIAENLKNSDYGAFQGNYVGKAQMNRLKEAKALIMKFRSSMSIG